MKKGLLFAAAGVMALAACQEKGGYTINGTIADAKDGDYVYMRYYDGREAFTLDSAVVKNGKFEFKGMPDSVFAPKFIIYGDETQNINATVFIEDGTIKVDMAEGNSKVSGTPSNDLPLLQLSVQILLLLMYRKIRWLRHTTRYQKNTWILYMLRQKLISTMQ